jgi:hypothetical protein
MMAEQIDVSAFIVDQVERFANGQGEKYGRFD